MLTLATVTPAALVAQSLDAVRAELGPVVAEPGDALHRMAEGEIRAERERRAAAAGPLPATPARRGEDPDFLEAERLFMEAEWDLREQISKQLSAYDDKIQAALDTGQNVLKGGGYDYMTTMAVAGLLKRIASEYADFATPAHPERQKRYRALLRVSNAISDKRMPSFNHRAEVSAYAAAEQARLRSPAVPAKPAKPTGPASATPTTQAGLDIEAMPGLSAARKETLRLARALGASDKVLAGIASEPRMARKAEISLPGRYGNASRATGWARLGRANTPNVSWGQKEKDSLGHLVFTVDKPGKWEVMSSDGFNREERVKWEVTAYKVGDQVWFGAAKL
jgi:hypothetical protein